MVPLDPEAAGRVLKWDLGEHRSVSIRHALIHRSPGLWGDHPRFPRSVLFVRDTEADSRHVFGAGTADPALGWLIRQGWRFSLLAPSTWEGAILRRAYHQVRRGIVETWIRSTVPDAVSSAAAVRRLGPDDADGFQAVAPDWGLRGWGRFDRLIQNGSAFGVPTLAGGFASVAWIFEADHRLDSIAVATDPRFVRLGLGRAVASELVNYVEHCRMKTPVWTVAAENSASKALARSIGFSPRALETVIRWGS